MVGKLSTKIENKNCQLYKHNALPDGEFDELELNERWIISYADYHFHWDGYMRDALLVTNRP